MGFGSFLSFYLATLGWSKEDVGLALSVGSLAAILSLVPAGALLDAARSKRRLVAAGIVAIAAAALILAWWPTGFGVFAAEVLHGGTAGLIGPAIGAISLGLAGRRGMSLRVGRNYRFAAAGNALTAALMGAVGSYLSNSAIFLVVTVTCVPTLIALAFIDPREIDYARARNAARKGGALTTLRVTELTRSRGLLLFALCLVLFQLSNASQLSLVSQNLGRGELRTSSLLVAGMIIVPQAVFALLAPWIGYWSEIFGRKPLLLIGFAADALRATLYAFVSDPYAMLAIQFLDGVTSSVVTALTVLVIADLTAGTGRFNLAQGVVGVLTGLAATFSTPVLGTVAQHLGDRAGFLAMAGLSSLAAVALWTLVPETRPSEYGE